MATGTAEGWWEVLIKDEWGEVIGRHLAGSLTFSQYTPVWSTMLCLNGRLGENRLRITQARAATQIACFSAPVHWTSVKAAKDSSL